MVNFRPLAAEIVSLVWGTPANFNGFRVLAALLLVVGVSQTAAFNRERHLYSAGRPSRWALAHMSSLQCAAIPSRLKLPLRVGDLIHGSFGPPESKRHLDRFCRFCIGSQQRFPLLYNGPPLFVFNIAPSHGGSGTHLIRGSLLGPPEFTTSPRTS